MDVASCAFVVRFNAIHTTKRHTQGAGRARLPRATIYYMENDPHEEVAKAELMQGVAADTSLPGPSELVGGPVSLGFELIPGRHPYVCPRTGAEVNFSNAKKLLEMYIMKVTRGQAKLKSKKQYRIE